MHARCRIKLNVQISGNKKKNRLYAICSRSVENRSPMQSWHCEGKQSTANQTIRVSENTNGPEHKTKRDTQRQISYPTSPLGDRWFRGCFNQITSFPTLSPGLQPGPLGSVAGLYHFLQDLRKRQAIASQNSTLLTPTLLFS